MLEAAVIKPFAFTVNVDTWVVVPKDPTLAFTVDKVNAPVEAKVASPETETSAYPVFPAFPTNNCPAVGVVVIPVPPFATAIVVPVHVPDVIVPTEVKLPDQDQ